MTVARIETLLATPPGFRSARVAQFLWQMDEQRRALLDGVRDLTPEALQWQPAPGTNSVGMLLAHIAYAEAHLVQVGVLGEQDGHAQDVIGITEEQEGLPLAPGAPPSPALAGKDLAFFVDVLARARAHTRRVAQSLEDADLERQVHRRRPDGAERVFNVGWVFYHLLEHEAGHRGQIGLVNHLRRLAGGG
jgi:uncharacterized damage-inducible protein DinB